jgi:hypothetical protein
MAGLVHVAEHSDSDDISRDPMVCCAHADAAWLIGEIMAGVYANKFTIEINDMARIVFVDERVPIREGLPMASTTAAEIVMTHANFLALAEHMGKAAEKLKGG